MRKNAEISSEEKVAVLRELCQGYGLISPESFTQHEETLRTIVDAEPADLDEMFKKAGEAMTPGKYKDAFLNALWGRDFKNLTERRTEYIAKQGNVTYRTLVTREQEGAEIFLKFLEAEAKSRQFHHHHSIRNDDEHEDPDVEALRHRVARLEGLVGQLHDMLHSAYMDIARLVHLNDDEELRSGFDYHFDKFVSSQTRDGLKLSDLVRNLPDSSRIYLFRPETTPSSESQPDQD